MARFLFAGDTVLPENNSHCISVQLSQLIADHDVASCNLEGPLDGFGSPITKVGPHVSQPQNTIEALKKAGFTLFSLANNHAMDYGDRGLLETIKAIGDTQVIGAGIDWPAASRTFIHEEAGVKYGFLSFAEWGFGAIEAEATTGFAWINHPKANQVIKDAKAMVDFLIIQIHAGVEDIPIPWPEWRTRYKEIIDLGADLVIGHHSHTIQGHEAYSGGHIFYSLGNFFFHKPNPSPDWNTGMVLSVTVTDGKVDFSPIPTLVTDGIVDIDDSTERTDTLTRPTKLLNDTYEKLVDELAQKLWISHYRHFTVRAEGGYSSWKGFLRYALYRLLGRPQIDKNLQIHNTKIESHHYAIARAQHVLNLRT